MQLKLFVTSEERMGLFVFRRARISGYLFHVAISSYIPTILLLISLIQFRVPNDLTPPPTLMLTRGTIVTLHVNSSNRLDVLQVTLVNKLLDI